MPGAARTFRVFVSSTFADLKAERNALQERVFPKLRELCQQHGARFQAIDLRWGVSAEAALDQLTMTICLDELRRCQQVTPRPNFIVLLGERYGWRPLPPRIPEREFALITPQLTDEEGDLLAQWYWRDDNAVPPEYLLQPRKLELPEGASEQRLAAQEREEQEWEGTEGRLRELLLRAVRSLDPEQVALRKYERSATEQEIIAGALEAEREQAFCYLRTIAGLPEDEQAREFRDLGESAQLLQDLKARLRRELPEEHVYQYEAQWRDGLTDDHLDAFCARVEADLSAVIREELARTEEQDELMQEIKAHADFGRERARHFIGRQEALDAVRSYVRAESSHPLVVWGGSGSGKSAFLARCAQLLKQEHPEALAISRCIGATPASTDIRSLLESICRQLAREYGKDEREMPSEYKALAEDFPKRLALATAERPLVLLLDALDQLSPTDNAHSLQWLPRELPEHVHVIVSALQREGEAGRALEAARARWPQSLLELRPMSVEDGEQILKAWLAAAHRALQPIQRDDILRNFRQCGLPLYLRLAFEEAKRWKSYDGLPRGADDTPGLNDSVEGILLDLFARLESPAHHGPVLTSRALGYLAAARNGVTEDELLDVLSADTAVMENFRQRNPRSPGVDRLPVVLWSRLHDGLAPYLIERSADHTALLGFYHRQLGEAVQGRYLREEEAVPRHRALAEYFDAQPLWCGEELARTPNYRKVSELPYQQTEAQAWEELERTLTDLVFVEAKCTAGMSYGLVADYVAAQTADVASEAGDHIHAFAQFVRGRSHLLLHRPDLTLQEAYNLAASGPVPEQATRLLDDPAFPKRPWLRLMNRPTAPYARCLLTLEGHGGPVAGVAVTPNGKQVVTGSGDRTVKVWDLATGQCRQTLEGHADLVRAVAVTPDGKQAVTGSGDRTVKVWELATGQCRQTLEGHAEWVSAVAVTPDGKQVVTGSGDRSVKVWDLATGQCRQTLEGHAEWVSAVAVTPDGKQAVTGCVDRTVKVWDLATGRCRQTLEGHADRVLAVAVTPDGKQAVTGSGDRTVKVWDLATGRCRQTLEGHADRVRAVAVTPDGKQVVTGSGDRTVKVWELATGQCRQTLEGHAEWVSAVAVTPDGKQAVTGSSDRTAKVWDLGTGEWGQTPEGHADRVRAVAITPDGKQAVTGSSDRTVKVWDLASGQCRQTLAGHSDRVLAVAVTPDGKQAVTGSGDRTVKVWDLATGLCRQTLDAHTGAVRAVAVTPDGRQAVTGGSEGTVRVWDLATARCRQALAGHVRAVRAVAVTPDGKHAVTGSGDRTVKVWDLATGGCSQTLLGHTEWVSAIAVTPDGKEAVTGSGDRTVKVWDLATRRCRQTLKGHAAWVSAVAVTPDGKQVVTGSYDRTVKVWDLGAGKERACSAASGPVSTCVCSPDGTRIIVGDEHGKLYVLRPENMPIGPPILTPWHSPLDQTHAFGCILCCIWSEVPESALGTELPCPNCGRPVKLNPFVIEADWRPVAAAWRGGR